MVWQLYWKLRTRLIKWGSLVNSPVFLDRAVSSCPTIQLHLSNSAECYTQGITIHTTECEIEAHLLPYHSSKPEWFMDPAPFDYIVMLQVHHMCKMTRTQACLLSYI